MRAVPGLALLAVCACGAPSPPRVSREFVLSVDPGRGTAELTGVESLAAALHTPRDVVSNGTAGSGPPGTWEIETTEVLFGGQGRCRLGRNCFGLVVRSFEASDAYSVLLRVDRVSPASGHDLADPDLTPPAVAPHLGVRIVGDVPAGGAASTTLDFLAPTMAPYRVRGSLLADDGRIKVTLRSLDDFSPIALAWHDPSSGSLVLEPPCSNATCEYALPRGTDLHATSFSPGMTFCPSYSMVPSAPPAAMCLYDTSLGLPVVICDVAELISDETITVRWSQTDCP